MSVTVVDYGMGNLRSIRGALEFLGVPHRVSADPAEIAAADRLILPGVGSFGAAMRNIEARGLGEPLEEAVMRRGRPILGICLGMQLFAAWGEEEGRTRGLGWIPGRVARFRFDDPSLKVPHVGFNTAEVARGDEPLFEGLGGGADFYFVHSYRLEPEEPSSVTSWTDYGGRFPASVRRGNVTGTQFHPEKSQSNGLRLLRNFARS